MKKGFLVLETGDIFEGSMIGCGNDVTGEVVFNTSMTGYQEIISDPSYAGQIITFCYPLIGNYGINLLDNESDKLHLAGVVIGEVCEQPSHYLAQKSFVEQLAEAGVTGITGIDTRALVKIIRQYGTVQGVITDSLAKVQQDESWKEVDKSQGTLSSWVEKVSTTEVKVYGNHGPHVVLIDYGFKKSILKALLHEGCKVTVVPYQSNYEQIKKLNPDGVFLSNGPGDPMALASYFAEIKKISTHFPSMGICLGHQLLALAHGAQTRKLKFGHRGGNHPVKEVSTGKVMITSQNHGYVVVDESIDSEVFTITHYNVNDGSIEGLKHKTLPVFTIQFHPEAHPGPCDTAHIFLEYIQQLQIGDMNYALT